jgi:hypothetical protein
MHDMFLRVESTVSYTNHRQVKVVYCYIVYRKGMLTIAKLVITFVLYCSCQFAI